MSFHIHPVRVAVGGIDLSLHRGHLIAQKCCVATGAFLPAYLQCSGQFLLWRYSQSGGLACQQVKVARATFPRGNRAITQLASGLRSRDKCQRSTALNRSNFTSSNLYELNRKLILPFASRKYNLSVNLTFFRGNYIRVSKFCRNGYSLGINK